MKLSVVIPAYNEQERIGKTLENIHTYLKDQEYAYEVIVVVNNTHDRTLEIVKKYGQAYMPELLAVDVLEGGKGNAVKRGILEHATGDIIMFMDADNATPIAEVAKFLPYFNQGYDVVIGSRELQPELLKVKQTLKRQILGHLSHWLIRVVLLPGIYDTQLGFKAFKKQPALAIFSQVKILGWAFDMEVLAIARFLGYKIKEVGVEWSEYGGGHVPAKAFSESFVDLFRIKWHILKKTYKKF